MNTTITTQATTTAQQNEQNSAADTISRQGPVPALCPLGHSPARPSSAAESQHSQGLPVVTGEAETACYHPESSPRIGLKTKESLPLVSRGSDVWRLLRPMEDLDREHFVVLHLDIRNRVMRQETVSIGCLTGVDVHPREVFKNAIIGSAATLIIVHNHPSGDPSPSSQDIELTARFSQCGKLLGIAVLDHIIIGREGFVSLAERGAMNG